MDNIELDNYLFNADLFHICLSLSFMERKIIKVLLPQKEYKREISYQIRKQICFNINQLFRKTLHRLVIYSMFV